MNQQNKVLQNVSARQAINQTIDRKSFVNTLLNDGSTSTLGLVPKTLQKDLKEKTSVLQTAI